MKTVKNSRKTVRRMKTVWWTMRMKKSPWMEKHTAGTDYGNSLPWGR